MGYYITIDPYDVVIPVKKVEAALAAINNLQREGAQPEEDFTDLQDALKAWKYETEKGIYGDITVTYFQGEELGEDEKLWSALGPYVSALGYIDCRGEDETFWRWSFNGSSMEELSGSIIYGIDERPLAITLSQIHNCLVDRELTIDARIEKAMQIVCGAIAKYSIQSL